MTAKFGNSWKRRKRQFVIEQEYGRPSLRKCGRDLDLAEVSTADDVSG